MVTEVNKIVYNTLITERAITLPNVGTLSVVRHAATMISKDVVASPKLSIEFSSHAKAISIVELIAQIGGVEVTAAEDIYSRWLEKVRNGSTLTIEGVGVLRNKSFEVDKELDSLLNGASATPVTVRHIRKNRTALWFGFALSIITLALSLIVIFKDDVATMFNGCACVKYVETTSVESAEVAVDDSVTSVDTHVAYVVDESVAEEEFVAVNDIEDEQTPLVDDWTLRDDIRHWVVVGSYSTMENAELAVTTTEKSNEEIRCKIFKLGKMFAVAIYGSDDYEECAEYKQKYSNKFKQAWIFTPKEYR